jgi:hypothetical protein
MSASTASASIPLRSTPDGDRYELTSPTAMPKAGGFLWNQRMMIQATCRGYATAQFMHVGIASLRIGMVFLRLTSWERIRR